MSNQKMTLRFYVASLTENAGGSFNVVLMPSYGHGSNAEWAKYTPAGRIELSLSEDVAIEFYREALRTKATLHIEMSPVDIVPSNLGGPQ